MKTILVPALVYNEIQASLAQSPLEVTVIPYSEETDEKVDADGAIGLFRWMAGTRYAELIDRIPSITWLHTGSAGVDHVLTPTIQNRAGMVLTDSGPAFGPAIAEYVLAAMLSDARRLVEFRENQKKHIWQKLPQRELLGATIGIIGLGPIGLAVAQRAKAFGMITVGYRRNQKPAANVDRVLVDDSGLNELLAVSDYVVLAAAHTAETRHLLSAAELALMKPDALLINIARGALIDEAALIYSLKAGSLRGAVLDVFSTEPLPAESELWNLPNVVMTPHNSFGAAPGLKQRQIDIFLDNLRLFSHGLPLENVVDIARGY
jgi:phosphoglycerate dehydrogenase-like enzyme